MTQHGFFGSVFLLAGAFLKGTLFLWYAAWDGAKLLFLGDFSWGMAHRLLPLPHRHPKSKGEGKKALTPTSPSPPVAGRAAGAS